MVQPSTRYRRVRAVDRSTGRAHAAGSARALVLAAAATIVAGCGAAREPSATEVRDSAGVTIVENEAPDSPRLAVWSVAATPELDIGRLEGSDEETLYRVAGAARLSDGRVAIANSGTSEIRYYGPDGRHLRTAGGEGGGPGEFQRITALIAMPADSVAVVDVAARRVSVLDPDGAFAREVSTGASASMLMVVGRRGDGAWLASASGGGNAGGLQEGLTRPDAIWVSIAPGGGAPDTLARVAGTERVLHLGQTNGRVTFVEINTPPFGRTTTVLPSGDDLLVATQDAAQVEILGPDGALRRIIRTGVPLRPVTPELVDAYLERRYANAPPERRRDAIEAGKNMPAGAFVPPYGSVTLDRAGDLWIQDYAGLTDENRWTVYAAGGTPLGRIALPASFTPYDIGEDWILGRELDELEVEHVRLYVLRKTGPAR